MRPADAPGDTPDDRSSEAWLPGLAENARIMADAVIVTDLDRLVVVWNDAAGDLYGIDPALALGAPIETLFDSEIIGAESDPSGVRDLALQRGSWRGRVTDRPLVGDRIGDEIVIDVMLSRLVDGPGKPIGVLSVKRDVTAGVRLEREVASLGSLASATGEARSRTTLAERALGVVAAATGADHGVIVIANAGAGQVLASTGQLPGIELIMDVPWADAPAIRAVTPVGRVIKGPVDRLPLVPASRRHFLEGGVGWLLVVGLHREEELIGVLSLGWKDRVPLPSDSVTLLAATTIARGLENARLVEEIVRRADQQRATAIRLRKLDGLTRLGGHVETIDELATASCRLIKDALAADGAAYGLLAPDGDRYETSVFVDVPEPFERWLRDRGPRGPSAFVRWRASEDPYIAPLGDGSVPDDLAAIAREVGLATFAVIPIRIDGVIAGRIAVYFRRPIGEVHLEAATMEQVGTIVSIALQNFQLGDRLVRSERRYRTMFEASPDPMMVVTPDGEVIDANHAATRLFGAPREWMIGRPPGELVKVDPRFPPMAVTLPVGASFTTDAIGIRRDGTQFPHESAVAAVELDGERQLIIRMHDLTDQERLQSELVQAQKMDAIGRLVSGVAHELNNPLAAILGFSQLIRRDDGLPESLRHNADLLISEAARTRGIVQNLLDFARQRPPERHPTSIARLVDSVLALQSYSLDRGPIEVDVDVPEDLPLVELDRGQAQQVLINLLNNAAYAVEHGGGTRIGIRAARVGRDADEAVRITVLDDGPGVPVEHIGRLFEPFFTTKPPTDGTGLGLSVSAGIVLAHGGDLRYQPSGWGTGAAFTFDLPARSLSAPDPGDAWSTPSEGGVDAPPTPSAILDDRSEGARILVLDDEPSILVFLEQALRSLGYRPEVTGMGEEAIELVANGMFDAILCDHRMDGLSGIDVWQAVVDARPDMADRWIMMSGDVLNPSLDAFAAANNVSVLAKPFDLETLDRALRYRLEAAGPSRG